MQELKRPGLFKGCFFTWLGSQASHLSDNVKGFCAPVGAQKPFTLSLESVADAQKTVA